MRQPRTSSNFRPKETKFKKVFHNTGNTFSAYYDATKWLRDNGFSCGSTECGTSPYVAIQKGEYTLPQKLRNFYKEEIKQMDGVIYSSDYRDGDVEVRLHDSFKEERSHDLY